MRATEGQGGTEAEGVDWIKWTIGLETKPEVIAIAASLNIDRYSAASRCMVVFGWFDQHTLDGRSTRVTASFFDSLLGLEGFASAMSAAGWLEIRSDRIALPNFARHHGASAKRRALDQLRKRASRDSASRPPPKRTRSGPDNNSPSPSFSGSGSQIGSGIGKTSVNEESSDAGTREPDPIWDTVAEVFFPGGVAGPSRTRVGKIVRDLKALGATADLIRARRDALDRSWGGRVTVSPETLVKHWASPEATHEPKPKFDIAAITAAAKKIDDERHLR